jgi:transposase
MSVFAPEVARPTLVFRGLLGRAKPILIAGGRATADYREAFVGIDVAKLKNAIAVAKSGRDGKVRYFGEIDASDGSMRRINSATSPRSLIKCISAMKPDLPVMASIG